METSESQSDDEFEIDAVSGVSYQRLGFIQFLKMFADLAQGSDTAKRD